MEGEPKEGKEGKERGAVLLLLLLRLLLLLLLRRRRRLLTVLEQLVPAATPRVGLDDRKGL